MAHLDDKYQLFHREFQTESDRAKVILSAAMLDEALAAMLRARLVPCADSKDQMFDGSNAPMASFSARVDFCYRLGLISSNFARDLHLIRKIRNEFAHNVTGCTFASSSVSNRVALLQQSFVHHLAIEANFNGLLETTIDIFQEVVGTMIFFLWNEIPSMESLQGAHEEFFYVEQEEKKDE